MHTGVTIGQVSCNCFGHSRPPMIVANKFVGGSPTGVAGCGVVIMSVDYVLIQVFIIRDIQEAINI